MVTDTIPVTPGYLPLPPLCLSDSFALPIRIPDRQSEPNPNPIRTQWGGSGVFGEYLTTILPAGFGPWIDGEEWIPRRVFTTKPYFCVMDLIHPLAQSYAEQYSPQENTQLLEIESRSKPHPHAHMLSGMLQGKFLEMISLMINPRYILEIGTFLGYSAICLARGLKPGGELHTLENDEVSARKARENFKNSETGNKIILHTGNALELLGRIDKPWDLVFLDADKTGYLAYYEVLVPKLRSGGVILADNVLFHGQVLEQPVKGKNALAIQAFNERVRNDGRVEKMMLTLRDGVYLIRKK